MSKYNASSIKVLKGLEAVRKRPGMYIGSTDINGLHHLVWEIIDNAMDEVLAGFASQIKVIMKNDGSIIVEDNGRGIPVDKDKGAKKTAIELIFTELHAGGKFGQEGGAYKISGGLNGVGSSVVNALSSRLVASVYRDQHEYETIFKDGGLIAKHTHKVGKTSKQGTKIQFWPNQQIFKQANFNFDLIAERLREASFLISGVEIILRQEGANSRSATFRAKNGIKEFVEFINESKTSVTNAYNFNDTFHNIEVEVGFQYTQDYNESLLSFVNNIKTPNGGAHLDGFKEGWTKIINDYAREQNLLKTKDKNLTGDDLREGLTAIIAVKVPENILGFVGQTKDALRTPEAKKAVWELLNKHFVYWLQEHKKSAQKIVTKAINAFKAREAARKARSDSRKARQAIKVKKILSGKLTPAQTKNPLEKELFLVEGDSAGGSAKLGRDRRYQAILPLRGKVINTEKAKLLDILKNEEIGTMMNAIGAGIGKDFAIKNAQYGKIIIMTDADTDGAHIQTLLLTFLFRYMRPLFENGRVFIALPPLYKLSKKNHDWYAWDDEELAELVSKNKGGDIQRYKGLGEMNANQLWETTMNPESRTLIQVSIHDAAVAERRVSTLMGDNVKSRRDWIDQNVEFSLEDDFQI